jgi:hypothetical protein
MIRALHSRLRPLNLNVRTQPPQKLNQIRARGFKGGANALSSNANSVDRAETSVILVSLTPLVLQLTT